MDTTKLVVGQEVSVAYEKYGYYFDEGKVVKVKPGGVEVQMPDETTTMPMDSPLPDGVEVRTLTMRTLGSLKVKDVVIAGRILQFDSNGWGYDRERKVECCPVRDTTKLVVGQEVFMASGVYYANGKVVKVTPEGVEVYLERNPLAGGAVTWQFDTKGKARDDRHVGTAEYGPYIIDTMPFEERKAELVEAARRRECLHKKYPDGSVIPSNEPLPPIFDGPFWDDPSCWR